MVHSFDGHASRRKPAPRGFDWGFWGKLFSGAVGMIALPFLLEWLISSEFASNTVLGAIPLALAWGCYALAKAQRPFLSGVVAALAAVMLLVFAMAAGGYLPDRSCEVVVTDSGLIT